MTNIECYVCGTVLNGKSLMYDHLEDHRQEAEDMINGVDCQQSEMQL